MKSSPTHPHPFAPAPHSVVHEGHPATGRYAGSPPVIDWSGLQGEFRRSALWRRLHHKRWHYLGIATEHCFIGIAMVDLGWANTAFVYLFDRHQKTLLVDYAQDGLPGLNARVTQHPVQGAASWFKHTGASVRYRQLKGSRFKLMVKVHQKLDIDAVVDLQGAAPFLTAIGPIFDGGCAHATVKSSALTIHGNARAGGKTFDLDGGVASFDYSNGLLARNTQWRWASAHSSTVGFNLQSGYFGDQENVLWLDGQLIALGHAHFDFDPLQPLKPWHISTDDGLLDLIFQPEGARQQRKNLLVAASDYIQPIGTFSGKVKSSRRSAGHKVNKLVGVTEDHQSRW